MEESLSELMRRRVLGSESMDLIKRWIKQQEILKELLKHSNVRIVWGSGNGKRQRNKQNNQATSKDSARP